MGSTRTLRPLGCWSPFPAYPASQEFTSWSWSLLKCTMYKDQSCRVSAEPGTRCCSPVIFKRWTTYPTRRCDNQRFYFTRASTLLVITRTDSVHLRTEQCSSHMDPTCSHS